MALTPVDQQNPKSHSINTDTVLVFPEPGSVVPVKNICLATKDIPLQLLYSAYMQGVFPWFNEDEGEPVLWYSPNPRFCLPVELFHVPKRIERFLKHTPYTYTMNRCFRTVMENCRDMSRRGQDGSWIGHKMIDAYEAFHQEGFAHSVEAWHNGVLVGGLYGVLMGSVFCGESMFTTESDSSKSAFVLFMKAFTACGGKLLDSQVYTDNIARYGARNISRDAFLRLEQKALRVPLTGNLFNTFEELASSCGTERA
ncbi:MAG: leucyl/phenylalanyl-tRNA--protein transferase [Treponema sp.]|nr:leucyl/phenylalanyl-tRNA--protein transferase [Treponema sp.]